MRSLNFDLSPEPTFDPRFVNKKKASHNPKAAAMLVEAGYRFPAKWANGNTRQFVAWDGEGITSPGKVVQDYVLFGASTGDYVIKPSLSTEQCFDLLLSVEASNPHAFHVGFALQYDVNMMLRDLSYWHLRRIYRTGKCRWNGYRIEYRPGKWLSLRQDSVKVRLFDVFGFFQMSFVKACEKFLGANDPELVRIREGKAARRSFTFDQLEPFIVPYWEAELRLLVRLMDSLRSDLNDAGIPIASWHGPGAVANTVFRQFNVKAAKKESPQEVKDAAQYAYAGGRFELFRCGHYPNTVYEYDLNSAYPAAIAELPNLQQGTWRLAKSFEPESFGVWRISYRYRGSVRKQWFQPQPLFVRDKHGNVSYPPIADGWYWTPEAAFAASEVEYGWVFDHDGSKPFEFVRDMYDRRVQWKSEGKSAERALKLALNSLYGKMAQRSGWKREGDPIPTWHQLEWAGYVTSKTRSRLWEAIVSCGEVADSLIALETDAIFLKEPLPHLPITQSLGDWSQTIFDWITYIQSGLYFAGNGNETIERYRGFDHDSITHKGVMEHLQAVDDGAASSMFGITTRFIGLGLALNTKAVWRSWPTEPRRISLGGGKRLHVSGLCPECETERPLSNSLHTMVVATSGGKSHPHKLPWLGDEQPELRRLVELEQW